MKVVAHVNGSYQIFLTCRLFRNLMHAGPQMSSFLLCKVWHYKSVCTSGGYDQNSITFQSCVSLQRLMKGFDVAVY